MQIELTDEQAETVEAALFIGVDNYAQLVRESIADAVAAENFARAGDDVAAAVADEHEADVAATARELGHLAAVLLLLDPDADEMGEPAVCLAGNPTAAGRWRCGEPYCVCAQVDEG